MSLALQILNALKVKNRFNISKQAFLLVSILCALPFLTVQIRLFRYDAESQIDFNLYANIWIIFGIAVALFTAILAFIDYYIRKEITITLFGITLLGSVALDLYTLFIINNQRVFTEMLQEKLYAIFLTNRLLSGATLFLGTAYYLNIQEQEISDNQKKDRLILKISVVYAIIWSIAFFAVSSNFLIGRLVVTLGDLNIDLIAFSPLFLFGAWSFILLPKFLNRYETVFSKFLILSVAPIFLAQLFIAVSANVFDTSFNAAHYLRFISYLVPLLGIVFNYIETFKKERLIVARLDTEIAEKQKFAEILTSRERLLAQAQSIAHLGSYEIPKKGSYINWSDELFRICGLERNTSSIDYAIFEDIIPSNHFNLIDEKVKKTLSSGGSFSIEHKIIKKDGSIRWVTNQGFFADNDQTLYGVIQDITELHLANLKVKENEALLREAQAIAHNGSWELREHGQELIWSDEMYHIHGVLPNSMLLIPDEYPERWIHPEDRAPNSAKFQTALINKTGFDINYRIIRPDGTIRHVYTVAKFKETETGGFVYLGNTQDVTLLKEVERQLAEKNEELATSNKELEQFAYIASHDLQEPLRKIRAFGERLKERFNHLVATDAQDYINRMQNAAERMQVLIDDLLSFAKVSRSHENFAHVKLSELISQVISDLEYPIEQMGATFEIRVNGKILVVPSLMQQAFQNILSNSLKFAKPNVKPKIEIDSKITFGHHLQIEKINPNRQYCVVRFKDNGIGFDSAYATKIFDLFQRLHSKTQFNGTGLGLAICKKIVEHHDGFIFAEAEEGKGASFFFVLPIK